MGEKSYLVQCLPQRGFTERRRSGLLFTAEGVQLTEAEMTGAIREDPGLRVIELPPGAVIAGATPAGAEVAGTAAAGEDAGGERSGCAYTKLDGSPCRNKAQAGGEFCRVHTDAGSEAGVGEGATVTTV